MIVLENKGFDNTFGPSSEAPYLSQDAGRRRASCCPTTTGSATSSLDNYIAMVSGQGPNPQTQGDCQVFTEFTAGDHRPRRPGAGPGLRLPRRGRRRSPTSSTDEGPDAGRATWRTWATTRPRAKTCRHPDDRRAATRPSRRELGDQYAARHNPFVYFHSIIDRPSCAANDVPLDRLPGDLRQRVDRRRATRFITPNLCNDAHDEPCVDGRPGEARERRTSSSRTGCRGSSHSPGLPRGRPADRDLRRSRGLTRHARAAARPRAPTPRTTAVSTRARAAGAPAP
ncbi:MAG: hypothetical protein WKF40_07840 [Thermoleophilaceae bacterium]